MATPRRCIVVRGGADESAAAAARLTASIPRGLTLWVGPGGPEHVSVVTAREVRGLLGRSFAAVVIDFTESVDADLLGQAEGFVVRGGALILRMPEQSQMPTAGPIALTVPPFTAREVGTRFWQRLERKLTAAFVEDAAAEPVGPSLSSSSSSSDWAPIGGTREQAEVAEELGELFAAPRPELVALVADRGRGKSSALGLAITDARARRGPEHTEPFIVTAPHQHAADELFRHAADGAARFLAPRALLKERTTPAVIIVDEAAQLPVPWLRALVARYPESTIAFATTARGYEGTGRGFVLRFLEELRRDPRPLRSLALEEPIRWDVDDPLEALIFDVLATDATTATNLSATQLGPVVHRAVPKDELAADEPLLRELFGLLVHAHYRTTPSDLHRILDAPNLRLHGSFLGDRVVGVCLVALEGNLPPPLTAALFRGGRRIRGHALPETLISHSGVLEAGAMSFVRSVRIATHPTQRRKGIARGLAEHVHGSYSPDFFGTLFGATPGLVAFRRALGYELIRVGSSRGIRTGEPTAIMVRPVTPRARVLVAELRGALARDLGPALTLAGRDGELPLTADLQAAFLRDLPKPTPLSPDERARFVDRYALGGATYDSARGALESWVGEHRAALGALDIGAARIIRLRVEERRGWEEVREAMGHPTVPATMRALRRAARALRAELTRRP